MKDLKVGDYIVAIVDYETPMDNDEVVYSGVIYPKKGGRKHLIEGHKYKILYINRTYNSYSITDSIGCELIFTDVCFDINSKEYCFVTQKEYRKLKIKSLE